MSDSRRRPNFIKITPPNQMKYLLTSCAILALISSCTIKKSGPYGEYTYKKVDLSNLESMKKGVVCEEKFFDPTSNFETKLGQMIPEAKMKGRIAEVLFLEYSYEESIGIYKKYCLTSYGK